MKKFILAADDLAKSEFHNNAVLEASKNGFLKSTSIMVNMPFYEDALKRVIFKSKGLSVGLHLNIMEGKALNNNLDMLCDKNGYFKRSYLQLILLSQNKNFLAQIEHEFRSQIELALKDIKLTHIDSHVHVHAIPKIFELTAKLASEYKIPQIRTQAEIPYFIFDKKYNLQNFAKVLLLNYFSVKNKPVVKKYNLKTNDYLIGVSYTGAMDSKSILEGLKKIKNANTVEALIHPCIYPDKKEDSHTREYEITNDFMLRDLIENEGYKISGYIFEK